MGTLASQTEIGVYCRSIRLRRFRMDSGLSRPEKVKIVYAKSCNLVHFWSANSSQVLSNPIQPNPWQFCKKPLCVLRILKRQSFNF